MACPQHTQCLILFIIVSLLLEANSRPSGSRRAKKDHSEYIGNLRDGDYTVELNSSAESSGKTRTKRSIANPITTNHLGSAKWAFFENKDRQRRYINRRDELIHRKEYGAFHDPEGQMKVKPLKLRAVGTGINIAQSRKEKNPKTAEQEVLELLQKNLEPRLMEALNATGALTTTGKTNLVSSIQTNATITAEISTPSVILTSAEMIQAAETSTSGVITSTAENVIPRTTVSGFAVDEGTMCQTCSEVENLIVQEKLEEARPRLRGLVVEPTFSCDNWDPKSRTCFFDRNIGDTITFILTIKHLNGLVPHIVWRQEFHRRNSDTRKEAILDPDLSLWNVVIGSKGREFRISPITELDVDFNRFSATVSTDEHRDFENTVPQPMHKITFQIRTVPIDLGFVYPGEVLVLNIGSFVSLPLEAMTYKWYLENEGSESGTLPSNMRTSASGGSVAISELRKEQEGILTCSVYTNKGIFATKKRFLIKELNTDVLMSMKSPSDAESNKEKRDHGKILTRRSRQVHEKYDNNFETLDDDIDARDSLNPKTFRMENPGDVEESADRESGSILRPLETEIGNLQSSEQDTDRLNSQFNPSSQRDAYEYSNREQRVNSRNDDQDLINSANANSDIRNDVRDSDYVPQSDSERNYDVQRQPMEEVNHANHRVNSEGENSMNYVQGEVRQPSLERQMLSQNEEGSDAAASGHANNEAANGRLHKKRVKGTKHVQEQGRPNHKENDAQDTEHPKKTISRVHLVESGNQGVNDVAISFLKETENKEVRAEDKISRLIAYCRRDTQCSGNGICIRNNLKLTGFCRCLPGYHGNGIFCWEDIYIRNAKLEESEVRSTEAASPTTVTSQQPRRDFQEEMRKRRFARHKKHSMRI